MQDGSPLFSWSHSCAIQNENVNFTNQIIDSHILTLCIAEKDEDTCSGDSGGPLVRRWHSQQFVLVGITSFGFSPCGSKHIPGVYTQVSAIADWVYQRSNGEVFSDVRICGNSFHATDVQIEFSNNSTNGTDLAEFKCDKILNTQIIDEETENNLEKIYREVSYKCKK